jgi:hypothetical protein
MLDIRATIEGDRVLIEGLGRFARNTPEAVERGLERVVVGVHREAFDLLSGPGAKRSNVNAGEYPVPVRTGYLRQMLDYVLPGESKTGDVGTFTAGDLEAIVFNSALYAEAIHEGVFTSPKGYKYSPAFGPRPFMDDAYEKFDQGGRVAGILEEEIMKEMP